MRIALHTKVRADRIDDHEAAHRAVPEELTDAMRAAGAMRWTIWRSGTDLLHLLEVEDYGRLLSALERLPVNVAWQRGMAELQEVGHDTSGGSGAAALPVVRER